jgi:hypothetical protein
MDYFIDFANYKDSEVYFPNAGLVHIKRGQHIFGTPQLSGFLRLSRSLTRRKLKILKNIGFLIIKSTNRYSIATIINYDTYQPIELQTDQPEVIQPASNRPATGQQPATPNKDKKEKKVKNKEVSGSFDPPSEEILKEASIKKINTEIETVTEKLYQEKIFPKVHAFKNKMFKKSQNERAILHTLSRCYLKRKFDKSGAWGYCMKIMQVENGNYNESDYNKTA